MISSTLRPSAIAEDWYARENHPAGLEWPELLDLYVSSPDRLIIDEPDLFLLARPVKWSDQVGMATEKAFHLDQCDTWFVWMAIGQLRDIRGLFPYPLRYIAWRSEDEVLHFYEFARLKRVISLLYENGR